jgi:hypothetical protein
VLIIVVELIFVLLLLVLILVFFLDAGFLPTLVPSQHVPAALLLPLDPVQVLDHVDSSSALERRTVARTDTDPGTASSAQDGRHGHRVVLPVPVDRGGRRCAAMRVRRTGMRS